MGIIETTESAIQEFIEPADPLHPVASNCRSAVESKTSTLALAFASMAAWEGLPGSQLDMDDDGTSLVEGLALFSFELVMMTPS